MRKNDLVKFGEQCMKEWNQLSLDEQIGTPYNEFFILKINELCATKRNKYEAEHKNGLCIERGLMGMPLEGNVVVKNINDIAKGE